MTKKDPFDRIRSFIEDLPETSEKLSHGAPTFWGGKKTFACFHSGSYDEQKSIAVWVKAADGAQEMLVAADPKRFYRPKYLGPSGWVGIRLNGRIPWKEVERLLLEGYKLVAPKRAIKQLEEG